MTAKEIEAAPVGAVLWDDKVIGLHVRVFPSGRRKFYMQFRTKDRVSRRPKIGEYGPHSVASAREEAKKLLYRASVGLEDKKPKVRTVTELYEHYKEVHAHTQELGTRKQYETLWETRILPELGKKDITRVTEQDCRQIYHSMRATPVQANRVMQVLRAGMNLAEEWGWKPRHTNPMQIKLQGEDPRERIPTDEEAPVILNALRELIEKRPLFARYVLLLGLTGARPGELQTAKHEWITARGLELPKAKRRKKGRLIALSETARVIIAELPKVMDNPYLFPGKKRGTHFVAIRAMWGEFLRSIGVKDLQLRDWRRYFASLLISDGIDVAVIKQILGHSRNSRVTEAVYAKALPKAKLRAAETAAAALVRIGGFVHSG